MVYTNARSAYQQTSVQTASPERLLIMLYDGLIRFINVAGNALDSGDLPNAHANLIYAQDIVLELRSSLKSEYEISKSLHDLYDFVLRKLIEANVTKDVAVVREIQPIVEELKDTWVQAAIVVGSNREQPTFG